MERRLGGWTPTYPAHSHVWTQQLGKLKEFSFSLELVRQNIKQRFSHFSVNHLRIVLKMQIPLQDDWGGGQDFAFLTSFKVILVLPAQGPQPEKRGTR